MSKLYKGAMHPYICIGVKYMRLDKFIVGCSKASRSEVKKFVKNGRITVNNVVQKKSDIHIDEINDVITLDGQHLLYREFIYLMLNKPAGYISATYDKKLPVVVDLIPDEFKHFDAFPVGRLDIDTEGLLVLTNDGKFTHEVTSPKKNVYKTYYAKLDAPAQEEDIQTFLQGMNLGDFTTKTAYLEILDNPCEVFVKICEGKFHQVKRMCEKVGKKVIYLKRISIGDLHLDENLQLGESRELTKEELLLIRNEGK